MRESKLQKIYLIVMIVSIIIGTIIALIYLFLDLSSITMLPTEINLYFISNDENVETKAVEYGSLYGTLPMAPPRDGYIFVGWYLDSDFSTGIVSTSKVEIRDSQYIYAKWIPVIVTVTLNPSGGSSISTKTATFGSEYGMLGKLTRCGFVFDGWFDASTGGNQVISSTIVTNSSDHTLFARWRR